jgi:penicillin-binding protein 1A
MDRRFEAKKVTTGLFGGILRVIGVLGKTVGTVLLIIITTGLVFACIFAFYVKFNLSSELDITLTNYDLSESSVIYYVDDETGLSYELQTLYGSENRVVVQYADIPKNLINAAVAIEDKRFYTHQGVDWYRTAAAVFNMFLRQEDTFGGSTITQQLIKNLTGLDQVTVKRKLVEIFQALELEKKYTKDQIMEWYLNTIYFGERCYGVETASYEYYGKDVYELSLAECAALIGITNNPSMYDPYISDKTLANNKERQVNILNEMLEQGKISQEEYDQAVSEQLVFQRGSDKEAQDDSQQNSVYSWFVDEVIRDVTSDLMTKFGINEAAAQMMLYTGGYSIYFHRGHGHSEYCGPGIFQYR